MAIFGIAANSLNAPRHTGVERYLVSVLRAMMAQPLREGDRVVLYVAKVPEGWTLPQGWAWRVLPWRVKGWTHVRLSWELWRNSPDVFWNPTHEVPLCTGRATVVSTVHDLAFKRFPGSYDRKNARRQAWAIRQAVRRSARMLAISATTKRDLEELYGVASARIAVTPLGVDAAALRAPLQEDVLRTYNLTPGRYVLYVGRLEGKKNVATLVRGYGEFLRSQPDAGVALVLAGGWGFGRERIEAALREAGGDVRVLGFVPDAALASLYAGAVAFCFPSYYEGFGLPVLEAFAAGVPVLASTAPALVEVAGDAALFAPPEDAHAWAEQLRVIVGDAALREELAARGAVRAAMLTWEATAEATWKALYDVCTTTSRKV